MARRKQPAIPDALLDQLLGGRDAKTGLDKDSLLDELRKALAEPALNARSIITWRPARRMDGPTAEAGPGRQQPLSQAIDQKQENWRHFEPGSFPPAIPVFADCVF